MKKDYYFTWHLSLSCRWQKYQKEVFRDGGSVEWVYGPIVLEKRVHWLR